MVSLNSAGTKGFKQVDDETFDQICDRFDMYSRTTAVRIVRPIISARSDKRIYQSGRDLGLRNGMTLRAIAVDGFSIVPMTQSTQGEVDEWLAKRKS